jgi:hypothetical protein
MLLSEKFLAEIPLIKSDYFIIGFVVGALLLSWLIKAYDSYRKKKTYYKAKTAEKKAMDLLEVQGYRVIEVQPRRNVYYYLNGEKKKAYVKADFLARRYFRKVVCEVKTGENTRVTQAMIRRQLFDYYYAYGVREVILIDMEKNRIDRITLKRGLRWK